MTKVNLRLINAFKYCKLYEQVAFVISIYMYCIPNLRAMYNKLVTQNLQSWATTAFCDSAREVDGCKFHLRIMFGSRVTKTLTSLKWRR